MGGERVEGLSELGRAAVALAEMGFAVFPLRPRGKEPAVEHGFKQATTDVGRVEAWWRERPTCNVGIACGAPSGGLLAIDLDDHPERDVVGTERLGEWERAHGQLPETCSQVTGSGGYHLLYRVPEGAKAPTYKNSKLGVDARGEGAYIVAPPSVHPCGRRYEWETPPDELMPQPADANVMAFVEACRDRPSAARTDAPRYEAPEVISEGGRNDELARLCGQLWAKGLDRDMVRGALQEANRARCVPPLPEEEVDRIWESITSRPKGRSPEWEAAHGRGKAKSEKVFACVAVNGGVSYDGSIGKCLDLGIVKENKNGGYSVVHNAFGRYLIDCCHACHVERPSGVLAVWDGKSYRLGEDAVMGMVTEVYDAAKARDRAEVCEYVRLKAPVMQEAPTKLMAFSNGVYDLETGEISPHSPGVLISNVIPHDFDPSVMDWETGEGMTDDFRTVQAVLWKIADGNAERYLVLCEIVGACMYRRADPPGQCAVLIGEGSNGKSVFISMLHALLGYENISAVQLNRLDKNEFQAGLLMGKLANLSDDISNRFIDGDAFPIFKNAVTGEILHTDVKYKTPFDFRSKATFVVSANEFPRIGDTTPGALRRIYPVAFNHTFSPNDPDYNPHIKDDVTTEGACRALAALGILGLQRVLEHGKFTVTPESVEMVRDIRQNSDNVLRWLEETGTGASEAASSAVEVHYAAYRRWCDDSGCKAAERAAFSKRVNKILGTKTADRVWDDGMQRRRSKWFVVP